MCFHLFLQRRLLGAVPFHGPHHQRRASAPYLYGHRKPRQRNTHPGRHKEARHRVRFVSTKRRSPLGF